MVVKKGEQVHRARVFLHDLTPDSLNLFVQEPFHEDEEIVISISSGALPFSIQGKVTWCSEAPSGGRLIQATPFPYRIGVEILPENENERETLHKYCQEISLHPDPADEEEKRKEMRRQALTARLRDVSRGKGSLEAFFVLKPTPDEAQEILGLMRIWEKTEAWQARLDRIEGEIKIRMSLGYQL